MMGTRQDTRDMGAPRDGGESRMLDAWVRHDLADRYDGILREGLPPDLVALLSELA